MKRTLANILACLMILVFWLNQEATLHDKLAIRDKWKAVFNDDAYLKTSNLPTWQVIAVPTKLGWAVTVNEINLERLKANPANYTLAAFDNWKAANLDNPNHFQVRRGEDWRTIQAAEGMQTIGNEGPE